ncbi:DUF7683 domain-containing protein [Chryseobacterium arthrosphaerae]|uniref:DUF7683 domain-containing protein n=1 Tax=Chryseobacterium arthrosphaerae TaxID=651561 RepID=UPI001F4A26D4|nr:hypothetical protein [Chryseobacterium arthrosphaerae]
MKHKIQRSIEEYSLADGYIHKDYPLNITAKEIIKVLGDLILYEDDDEIYDQYDLTVEQVQKLKPFLKSSLNEDFDQYLYQLACYDQSEGEDEIK